MPRVADDAPFDVVPAEDAPTEAILEAPSETRQDAVPETRQDAETRTSTTDSPDEEGEPATRTDARRAADAEASPASGPDADAGHGSADEQDAAAAPHDLSDTMTQVLGDLLEPSPADEVATHAVDVVPQERNRGAAAASAARDEQPQPFWALAPDTRAVHDARGDTIFTIGPEAWILVLEDRGGAFVVRHDDGRVGYLHDTENMTRG
jgi:hypothetical protein